MKVRDAEWQQLVAGAPADELLDDLVAAGFQGLVIDRVGYADGGTAIEAQLAALRGQPARVSPDGRWSYVPIERTASAKTDAEPLHDAVGCSAHRWPAQTKAARIGSVQAMTRSSGAAPKAPCSSTSPNPPTNRRVCASR